METIYQLMITPKLFLDLDERSTEMVLYIYMYMYSGSSVIEAFSATRHRINQLRRTRFWDAEPGGVMVLWHPGQLFRAFSVPWRSG